MTPPAFDHHQIARGVPSPRLSIGRPARPSSPGRAATLSIINNQHQTDSHSRGGAPLGLRCDYRPAVGGIHGRSLFPAARGYDLPDCNLAGRFGVRSSFRAIDGIEAGSSHLVANLIQHRRQRGFQALAKRLPDHFKNSASNALKTSDGAKGSVPDQAGILPPDRGERPHVGHG
jgi:hypothetical protein